ncbi:MAG TPA: NADH-quinone oxidoreductase subunit J [Gemmatimonadaceae bacterium]|nr:NADH-quinone oxidoreductase subunit J [Gemmatimonadaceae bacterium]
MTTLPMHALLQALGQSAPVVPSPGAGTNAGLSMPHGTLSLWYTFHFYLFGLFAIASAMLFVTRKSPVAAALWLVSTMFALAALFVLLDAQFIGAIQVLVYAGAIMVVFLFVIMLLNLGRGEIGDTRAVGWKIVAGAVGVAILAEIFALTKSKTPVSLTLPEGFAARQIADSGAVTPIAGKLFTDYLLAFEITSVLLLAAVVGAVILGKQRGEEDAG